MINLITSTKIKLGNIWAKPLAFLAFALLLLSGKAISQAANLDQIRNGSATARISPADWVNGNAGPSNAHYAEGWSIPYRMIVTGLTTGTHTLIIEFDTKQSGGHALDFVTRYDFLDNPAGSHLATFGHVPETINPLLGLSGTFSAPSTRDFPIPGSVGSSVANEPTTTFNSLAGNTYMTIYNGSIGASGMSYDFQEAPSNANAASTTRLRIVFTANASTVVFAWGGHIATEHTWGVGQGATGVSGSPYHTRLISIDGSGGNQDRSLKASAVVIPKPPCTLNPATQTACAGTSGPLTYSFNSSTTGITNYSWALSNNTANAKIDGATSGASLTSVNIIAASAAGFTTGSFTLTLTTTNLGGTTPCTATGTINPAVVTSAGPDQTVCASSPAVTLAGSVSGGATTGTWSGGSGTFNPGATTLNAVYTPSAAEITAGTVTLTLTSADPAGPCAATSDQMVITINPAATADAGGPYAICASQASVTVVGTYGGGATGGTWSGGAGTFGTPTKDAAAKTVTVNYTPTAAEKTAGSVELTFTSTGQTAPCAAESEKATVTINANPTRPTVTYKGPECDQTTFSVTVVGAVTGGSYTLTQDAGGVGPVTKTTAVDAVNGNITFSNLTVGKGFSIVLKVGDCTSDATDCGNYKTPATVITKAQVAQPLIQENAGVTKVTAAPNPFTDKVRFTITPATSGRGTLDLYNMLGQKVKTVFQGQVQKGQVQTIEYSVPNSQRNMLLYQFYVGKERVTGKLLGLK